VEKDIVIARARLAAGWADHRPARGDRPALARFFQMDTKVINPPLYLRLIHFKEKACYIKGGVTFHIKEYAE